MTERDRLKRELWNELKGCTDLQSAENEIDLFMVEVDSELGDEIATAAWNWALNAQQFATIH